MKKILLFPCLLFSFSGFAQNPSFDWVVVSQNCAGGDNGKAVAIDAAGNSFATGRFTGTTDLDPGPGVATFTAGPTGSFYIARYDASGNYVWGIGIATTVSSETESIELDPAGNVIVCGSLQGSADFDPGVGVQTLSASHASGFVAKYDANGNYIWAFTIDATGLCVNMSIKTDAAGDIYTAGYFSDSADFDPGAGTFYLSSGAAQEHGYIAKYSSAGNLLFALPIGGVTGSFVLLNLAMSGSGSLAVCGYMMGTADFDPGAGVQNYTSNPGNADIFLAHYDVAGNFQWANVFGSAGNPSSANDYGRGVCFDAAGNVFLTGQFKSTVDFDPTTGTYNVTANGSSDAFIAKYNSSGMCQWAFGIGGSTYAYAQSVCADLAGNIYVTGTFENTADFDPGTPVKNLIASGTNLNDIFVASYTTAGTYRWAFSLGGTSLIDVGFEIETRGSWVYVVGQYAITVDFDPGTGTASYTYFGSKYDFFLARYTTDATGIANNSGNSGFNLYPNPAGDQLFITLNENTGGSTLLVYNELGAVVMRKEVAASSAIISIADLSPGLYSCVLINSEGMSSAQKFVVTQ